MLFSQHPRTHYDNAPVHEVICQVRFPAILTINDKAPAEFQDAIRGEFPQYLARRETGTSAQGKPVQITNHHFVAADSRCKVNLTQNFVSLSTLHYADWEEFARRLDKVLAAFIRVYSPAYFERVGLRYVNLISRRKLGLEDCGWTELVTAPYCAPMLEEDVREEMFIGSMLDFTVKADSNCVARIRSGPSRVKNNAPGAAQDPEMKFLLDIDLSMNGQLPCTLAAGALETLHTHAGRVFEGAVTDTLRNAME